MSKSRPILVSGSHRSGSTWVGNMIALSPEVQYVPESFKPNGLLRHHRLLSNWFQQFEMGESGRFAERLDRVFRGKFSIFEALSLFNPEGRFDLLNSPARLKFYRDCKWNYLTGRWNLRPLLKDPIALFSAEWLSQDFDSQNIILIRHPAAFVSSLLRLNWRFDFQNFLNQPRVMEKIIAPFEEKIRNFSGDFLEEACLLWSCLHFVIQKYREIYPNWIFIRHEDISRNPLAEFERLFQKLDVDFSVEIRREVMKFSASENPKEVQKSGQIHQLKRDSRANIKNWKRRLTIEQIERIRKLTSEVSDVFYGEDDW